MKATKNNFSVADAFIFRLVFEHRSIIRPNRSGKQIVSLMRVLLTGASGFIGGHLAEAFVQHSHHVVGIVRPTSRADFLQSLGVELVVSELEDAARLGDLMRGVDVVIHAAAQVDTHGFWRDFVQTTVEGTRHVLEAAQQAQVPHFIQISTVGVYGFPSPSGAPFTEANPYGHIHRWNYYSRAKIEAEKLVREAQQSNLITTTVIRPTWVYGPAGYDHTRPYRRRASYPPFQMDRERRQPTQLRARD